MKTKTYGELQTANEYLDNSDTLNSAFDQRGYLFLRDVLDTSKVQAVKNDLVQELQRQGFVKPGCSDPIWTGRDLVELDDERLYSLDYYAKLLDTDVTQEFFERLFIEPVYTFRSCTLRCTVPNDETHGSPPHQEHVYIRHTTDFRTFWMPLATWVGWPSLRALTSWTCASITNRTFTPIGPQGEKAKGSCAGWHYRALAHCHVPSRRRPGIPSPSASLGDTQPLRQNPALRRRPSPTRLLTEITTSADNRTGSAAVQGGCTASRYPGRGKSRDA